MKLTKYTHSCFVLEEQGKKLIVDPGTFSSEFGSVENVAGVVVTHVHPDHLSPENLATILAANPDVKVFTTAEVAEQWKDEHAVVVKAGDKQQVGSFTIEFFGENHTEIHPMKPVAQNISIMVNDTLFYPGDSFTLPERPVKVFALPANAPWAKVGETMEYVNDVKPASFFFRVHDDLLSDNGKMVYDIWLKTAAETFGSQYKPLEVGQSTEI